ncbi:UPF0175 family protein [Roseofilum reptotaenium CS-1145]|uniref:Uncharacterized protein n=1 Tax=Roseofilum reptotaenium AO1-A TaxID=1925591 RepID=A0A1L9QUM6_9CYAN|nr:MULTISPECIES: UPF0175 family protein [Roseofilum]MBP0028028.1 UPF0175 family protein [Roseofilum sp. Guam]MDB9517722.1 UPF0175 family protein [Roseofilum reptotaenium CS-1145]OJJ26326.1 hypothetical protein BI308_06860 [Roseofilum reptotaenium AO1-A]
MQITIEIPDKIAHQLDQDEEHLSHHLLELMVAESYRLGNISTAEVGQILKLPTRLATHAFLKRMGVYLNYDRAELEVDLQTLERFRGQ